MTQSRPLALVMVERMMFAPPSFLEFLGWVLRGGVDVDVRAEFFGERGLCPVRGQWRWCGSRLGCVLDGEVAESADAEDGDGVAGAGSGVAQGVEGGDAGAEQRRGVAVVEVSGIRARALAGAIT